VKEANILLLALLIQSSLEILEFFGVRREYAQLFPPKIGWRILFFIAGTGAGWLALRIFPSMRITDEKALEFPILIVVMLWFIRPNTLAINASGLTFYRFYGLRGSFISWNEAASMTSNWDDFEGRSLWNMLVRKPTVTVTSGDGKSVKFSYTNRGLGGFMEALREHIPARAFEPGLCDWKP
jgi:hypothetical protein